MYIGDEIRMRYVSKAIPPNLNHKLCLDAGCGAKLYKPIVEKLGYEWFGIDINPYDHEVARCSIEELNGVPAYALILCIDVLEHLNNPLKSIQNLTKRLMHGGIIVIHTPNISQKHILVTPADNPEHLRKGFSAKELFDMVNDDFTDVRIEPTFNWNEAMAWDISYLLIRGEFYLSQVLHDLLNFNASEFRNYGWLVTATKK